MKLRKITSLTALISFLLLVLTSVILYIVPPGRIAYWSDWHLWGLSKTEWGNLHINLGVLFLLAIFLHIYYNWKPILNYLKDKARKVTVFTVDFNAALVITIIVGLGTYFMIPPFSTVLLIGESIKDAGALKYGEPPFGHAELAPLDSLVQKTGLDLENSLEKLRAAGIQFDNRKEIFLDIAKKNKVTPKALYNLMKPAEIPGEEKPLPDTPPPGTGNKILANLCKEYGISMEKLSNDMRLKGYRIDMDRKMKDLAQENQMSPIELYDLIKQISERGQK